MRDTSDKIRMEVSRKMEMRNMLMSAHAEVTEMPKKNTKKKAVTIILVAAIVSALGLSVYAAIKGLDGLTFGRSSWGPSIEEDIKNSVPPREFISLQGYAEAGEAWVEDKIAQGARNVAFIDLNKRYNDWMNVELQRIHAVNASVSLNAAISYYYRSAKGANVDNTHINNAGADQAAYWVWYDARQRVAAGENAEEGSAAKVQADVLKGITEVDTGQ